MTERLTPEDIQFLRDWRRYEASGLPYATQLQIVDCMLHLHDERERLRNLDYRDVTTEQQERICEDCLHLTKKEIARSVRVMLGGET